MNDQPSLGGVSTLWTIVLNARDKDVAARQELCRRYHPAVERYLRSAIREPGVAGDLAQEFAIKVLRGDLSGVVRERGRFRDFVKGVLRHLITDHYRKRVREVQPGENAPEPASPHDDLAAMDQAWARGWRQELLNRAWNALADFQAKSGQLVFDVLRFRADNPELKSHEMAERLTQKLGKPVTGDWVRQNIHRARERFGDLLLAEIVDTLNDPTASDLEDELIELELLQYCQPAFLKWRSERTA